MATFPQMAESWRIARLNPAKHIAHCVLDTDTYNEVGERDIPYSAYFVSTQIGNAVTLVPATPGGLGMRDAVSSAFFEALGVAPSDKTGAIPVVNSILVVLWALAGAVCLGWLRVDLHKE